MTRTAVLICPGRGTYNKAELGYLSRYHSEKQALIGAFDAMRDATGRESVSALDAADRYSVSKYTRGDVASPLIYASAIADAQSLAEDIDIVAVTGNSMGWYIALAAAGALSPKAGFEVVNTMGQLMQQHLIGGQLVYPCQSEDWQLDRRRKAELLQLVSDIAMRPGHQLSLSIDLGGMLVLAGNAEGLDAFERAVPPVHDRFPMRLANHAAFHTELQAPVAAAGRARLSQSLFGPAKKPLVDGRGQIWWPGADTVESLWRYTLNTQVVEPYDFTRAVQVAAQEFAPDLFIIAGPGTTLGGAVAQSLAQINWQGLDGKAAFKTRQEQDPLVVAMGDPAQRALVSR
ncbi:malonyl CoA-acyl carrier protein transacylase-like protein [Phaeobacter piscinae]|uniref:[acyl-carrier-protein] S-malonyltransferase n=1 Tax=Phaeobacter piscinae TaxID=1580596 RepID=A0AAN1LBW0_9RHOB|nr:ACP S-malonyltransferase [Phaeobacter piscinae]ATG45063.1 malonyl CoA-acyl carrier protein transacylase-like protein [Phaeobacter piscinae]AUR37376.1 malonyl CoA-acyl carrier protein transacylase-like protein [Phaeobacter piscinae]